MGWGTGWGGEKGLWGRGVMGVGLWGRGRGYGVGKGLYGGGGAMEWGGEGLWKRGGSGNGGVASGNWAGLQFGGGVAFVVGVAPRGGRVPMKGAGLRVGGAPMWAGLRGGRGHPHLRGLNAINTHLGGQEIRRPQKWGSPPSPHSKNWGEPQRKGEGGGQEMR